jgi:hypothetical protein
VYRPLSALADYTEIIGHWHAHVGYRSRALPRGAITLIIDVGRRQQPDFYAADGRTRLSVPPAFLTGSHTSSYVSEMAADEPAMAAHFRPGGTPAWRPRWPRSKTTRRSGWWTSATWWACPPSG